jgi:CHAT domain-containing protein
MKRIITFLVFFSCCGQVLAQGTNPFQTIDQLILQNQTDKALLLIDLELDKQISEELSFQFEAKKAELLITQGKLSEAETILTSLQKKNLSEYQRAIALTTAGSLNMNKGRFDLALENLLASVELFQKSGKQDSRESAQNLATLAILYNTTGKYSQAEDNGLLALQMRQKLFGENSEETAASLNDLGLVYTSIDPDKALEYYDKALPIYESLYGKQHPKIAIANTNSGFVYKQLKLYGDAITNFENALLIWKAIYPNGHPNEAFVLSNLGQTYDKMGNNKTALEYLEKALSVYRKFYGVKHPDISSTLNQIGILKWKENKFDESIYTFQQALIANVSSFNDSDIKKNPPIRNFYSGYVLLYSLRWKAQAMESKYYSKTLKFDDLKSALSCLFTCDTLIDDIRHHSTDESDKISLGEQANEVYEDGVRIAHSMSDMTTDAKHYRETSFYFAEKSKSAVLQESIAEANAKSFAGIPQNLVEEEKAIKSTITFLSQKLSQKPSAEEEKYLRESLFNLNHEYDDFVKKLEKEFPNYYNLKFNQTTPTVGNLQKTLGRNSAIVSYFIAEKSKRIYQFIITAKKFSIRNLTLPDEFDRTLKGFTNSLLYSNLKIYQSTGDQLRRVLIPHFPHSITDIIIVPSGKLSTLPFEALPEQKKKAQDFQHTPFVVKRFALSYEFSAGLIAQKSKINQSDPASIFLCAPIQFPEADQLNDLPATDQEVMTIAQLFNNGPAFVAKNQEANETKVKSGDLKKYSYIHFATHGIVDETSPELSRIFLNTIDHEDGHLFTGEIYNLDLDAKLTVLSACQTGLGRLSKGEGVIGLSRALIYAGSENLIVSFWSVADESTALLMTDFYKKHLQQKQSFRMALQQAKIKMINEGKFSSPYYWAPFVMIGW